MTLLAPLLPIHFFMACTGQRFIMCDVYNVRSSSMWFWKPKMLPVPYFIFENIVVTCAKSFKRTSLHSGFTPSLETSVITKYSSGLQ